MQFVAIEAERFDAGTGGKGDFVHGTMTADRQPETIEYGSDRSPVWCLDTVSDSLPFYESGNSSGGGGGAIIEYDRPGAPATPGHPAKPAVGGQTTMIDRPRRDEKIVAKAFFDGNVRRVERRARFHQYLVRGEEVLYENELVVQDTYWHATDLPVRQTKLGRRGLTDKLAASHFEALIRRRPEFAYFQHPWKEVPPDSSPDESPSFLPGRKPPRN